MVPDNVEKIGCSHLENVGVEELAAKAGLGHSDGRFQQAQIADTGASTVPFNLIGVDLEDFLQAQKCRAHRSVGQPFERSPVAPVDLGQGGAKGFLALRVPHGKDDQAFSVGGHGKGGVGVDYGTSWVMMSRTSIVYTLVRGVKGYELRRFADGAHGRAFDAGD